MQKITQGHLAGLELALALTQSTDNIDELSEMLASALFDARLADAQPVGPSVPVNEFITRREDMGAGELRLLRQEDGDMCVSVISEEGDMAGIEFCTPITGGGRSPKVLDALYALARAVLEENQSRPLN